MILNFFEHLWTFWLAADTPSLRLPCKFDIVGWGGGLRAGVDDVCCWLRTRIMLHVRFCCWCSSVDDSSSLMGGGGVGGFGGLGGWWCSLLIADKNDFLRRMMQVANGFVHDVFRWMVQLVSAQQLFNLHMFFNFWRPAHKHVCFINVKTQIYYIFVMVSKTK